MINVHFPLKKSCAWEVQKFHDPINYSLTKLSYQNLNHLPTHHICCQCALTKLCFQFLKICLQGCFHHGSKVQISKLSVSFGKHMVGSDTTFWLLCHQFPFLLSVNFHLCMSHGMIHGHSLYVINVVYHLVQWVCCN
jgi:hypothetical protein